MPGRGVMRIATAVIVALALLAAPASAQFGGGGKRNRGGDDKKNEAKAPKVDEKAYKAALQRIPEPKEKYDPWGIARPANPAKTPK
jgi:hypothetical protein